MGSAKAVRDSLKGGSSANVKFIPSEDTITVRFLDEPEDFEGYYEHYVNGAYQPCATDECDGCDSDDPEEQRKQFRYLANVYVVDDQKVWAVKLTKTIVEQLMDFYKAYKGTIRDRDYDLGRTGSGKNDTRYRAVPGDREKIDLSRFDKKKHNLADILDAMISGESEVDDDEEEETPRRRSGKSKSAPKRRPKDDNPWDDDDEDDEEEDDDEPEVRRRPKKKTVGTKRTAKKSSSVKRRVRR
jgi:hypothetical protein